MLQGWQIARSFYDPDFALVVGRLKIRDQAVAHGDRQGQNRAGCHDTEMGFGPLDASDDRFERSDGEPSVPLDCRRAGGPGRSPACDMGTGGRMRRDPCAKRKTGYDIQA